jgi:hypothetical protein
MSSFKRAMNEKLINNLQESELFNQKLLPDIYDGKVFLAIRNNKASFYLKGRSLFTYESSHFSSHQKFVFIPDGLKGEYIREDQLANLRPIGSFIDGYEKIKKRTEQYADEEATGVSALYRYAAHSENIGERYFLVDIEIVFNKDSEDENRKTDKIDLLLYDQKGRKLLFIEAKHYTNPEILPVGNGIPKVINQLEKYNKQILANYDEIIRQYANAFNVYNQITGTKLSEPCEIHPRCGLYIFGFDNQGKIKVENLLRDVSAYINHRVNIIGGVKGRTAEQLFKELAQ